MMRKVFAAIFCCICFAAIAAAQKTVLVDHEGKKLTDIEFVDIRLANYQWEDHTIRTVLPDGTIQLQTEKILQENTQAPDFSVKTLAGTTLDTAALRGKVVVLNFWFPGCPPCRAERPRLNELKKKYEGKDVVFIAMTFDSASSVKRYLKDNPFDYEQVTDAEAAMSKFTFGGYPKNIVISRTGEIVYWRSGVRAWYQFEGAIDRELERSKQRD